MRSRKLNDEERTLWNEFTRSLKPLRATPAAPSAPLSKPLRAAPIAKPRLDAPAAVPEALDRRQKKRLARGVISIDARLDLHGLTQAQAHSHLLRFLRGAQNKRAKFVLVITGKGAPRADDHWELGKVAGTLRRQVPHWLSLPPFRAYVSAFEQANPAHGGEGALYIRIRRRA
jgi:DNA-nicking Smr family endonuclease